MSSTLSEKVTDLDAIPSAVREKAFFASQPHSKDLKRKSVRGAGITGLSQIIRLILQVGSTSVLARILTPEDFGFIAMVAVFTGFAALFKDLGLSMATVQQDKISHEQVSTLFWINVGASLVIAGIVCAIAPLIASFYGEPQLTLVTMAISASFIFGGLTAQHTALLRRDMRFRSLALIEVSAQLTGVLVALTLAWYGAGYWSLVAMTGTNAATTALLSSFISGWKPGRPHDTKEIWAMIRFGGNLSGFQIVNYLTRNSDNLLIGRFWGAGMLGIYSRAYSLLLLPLQQINGPISAVAIPALSRLQASPDQFRRYYLRVVEMIAFSTMPLVVLLAVLSEEIILIILGPRWIEAAMIFQVFAIAAFGQGVSTTTGWVLISLGKTNRLFKWGIIQSIFAILAFALGLPWGAIGVATSATIMVLLIILPSMIYAYKDTPIDLRDVGTSIKWPLICSGLLLIVTLGVKFLVQDGTLIFRAGVVSASALLLGLLVYRFASPVRLSVQNVMAGFK